MYWVPASKAIKNEKGYRVRRLRFACLGFRGVIPPFLHYVFGPLSA